MSSKRSTKNLACTSKAVNNHETTKQTKRTGTKKNAEPEVFVLPPNLLQKLGINLGNMASSNVCPVPDTPTDVISHEHTANIAVQDYPKPPVETPTKHTSILETAILMKKSVLLSPTFLPSGSHISGELEMSVGTDVSYTEELEQNLDIKKYVVAADFQGRGSDTLNEPNHSKVRKSVFAADLYPIKYPTDQAQSNSVIESSNSSLPIVIEHVLPDTANTVFHDTKEAILDDHQDEAYLSDCSNSNFSPVQNLSGSTYMPESQLLVSLEKNKSQACNPSDRVTFSASESLSLSQIINQKNVSNANMTDIVPVSRNTDISYKKFTTNHSSSNVCENPAAINDVASSTGVCCDVVFDENDAAQQLIELADLITNSVGNTDSELSNKQLVAAVMKENYCFDINTDESQQTKTELQRENKDISSNEKALDTSNIDVNSDMSIDFMVTNLEHLEENEEILDNFVKHLDLNDSSDILESIERMDDTNHAETVSIVIGGDKDSIIDEKNANSENVSVSIDNKQLQVLGSTSTLEDVVFKTFQINHIKNNVEEVPVSQINRNCKQLGIKHSPQKSSFNTSNKKFCQTKLDEYFKKRVNPPPNLEDTETSVSKRNVEKIAMLLCQFTNKQSTKIRSKVPSKDTKINDFNPKLSSDKVEQPGDVQKKEYTRNFSLDKNKVISKIQKHAKKSLSSGGKTVTKVYSRKSFTKSQNIDLEIDLIDDNPQKDYTCFKFCNCSDFGNLAFYDCNTLYEHIHFWDHKSSNCSTEDIFRIYEDYDIVSVVDTCEKMNVQEGVLDSSPTHSICWNGIGIELTKNQVSDDAQKSLQISIADHAIKQKEADIQKTVKKEAEMQNVVETEANTIKPVGKGAEMTKSVKKKKAATPKQSINKAQERDSVYYSQNTTEINQINTFNKIEIKTESCYALETINELLSENVRESENALIKQESSSNDHDVRQDEELASVPMVIDDTGADIPELTELNRLQSSKPNEVLTKKTDTNKISDAVIENKFNKKKTKRVSDIHPNAEQSLITETDFRKDVPKVVSQKSKRNSKRLSSKACSTDEDAPLSSIKTKKRRCSPSANETESNTKRHSPPQPEKKLVCGVCDEKMEEVQWIDHIAKEHDYMAWKDGETPLDVNDNIMVLRHLNGVSKQIKSLTCSSCGFVRKSAKAFLQHKRKCGKDKTDNDESVDSKHGKEKTKKDNSMDTKTDKVNNTVDMKPSVKCGVCKETVLLKDWIPHIQKLHDYMAWKDGETLDVNNEKEVFDHLYAIAKEAGQLMCPKCGLVRIYVKKYLHHIKSCDAVCSQKWSSNISHDEEVYTCGVCKDKVNQEDWQEHKMIEHYNVAWIEGEMPVDTRNPYAIEKLLKEYQKQYRTLMCKICGITRASCMGFYAHVLVCGKTEEEAEEFKILCTVCNKKYLCIYHVQHMGWHRSTDNSKQRQEMLEEEKREKDRKASEEDSSLTPGKRKAAQKAIAVLENYKTENQKCKHICKTCGFGTDTLQDMAKHQPKCIKSEKESDDVEDNIAQFDEESSSSDEFSGIDSDSDVSIAVEAEVTPRKRVKKHKHHLEREQDNTIRFPRVSKEPKKFLLKSGEEFHKFHLSGENLFPELRVYSYEPVPEKDVPNYLKPLEKSCKVKLYDEWITYSTFEAKKGKGLSLFVGSSIQSICWAPPANDTSSSYLAVASHRDMDCPRLSVHQTPSYPGLIQIWDFGKFDKLPHFAFGLAHDCGTVWAIDWCPSGSQDPMPDVLTPDCTLRMGLLATACSNGSAYIYSVPYPSTLVQEKNLLYKLKPVVELRLLMGSERKIYQATTLRWCPQKGHSLIVVGYADGTTAYYDLNTNSPLLKTKENDATVIYPYHDEQLLASSLAAVDVYPSMEPTAMGGAVCAGGATGAIAARGSDATSRLASRLACHSALFEPLWPAVLLTSDNTLTVRSSSTELEWTGRGRCVGGGGAAACCVRCARAAVYSPPLVRLLRPHPTAYELGRKTVGSIQTVEFKEQKKRKAGDDFATVIEPTTYEKAVKIYGIEFKLDRNLQPTLVSKCRDSWSQRFPLGDIVSMAFCPAEAHHHRLAIATFAGVVFVVDAS